MVLGGDAELAVKKLRTLLAREPTCLPARLNLANALLLETEPAEALALLEGIPPAGREGRFWKAHRATALIQLGRWPQARLAINSIPEPYGDAELLILSRRLALAEYDRNRTGATQLAARLAEIAAQEGPLPEHRIVAHFDLARFHERRGDEIKAFEQWRRGHRLLSRFQPFVRDDYRAFIDSSIGHFDTARLQQGPRAANLDETPIFIVGMPRSGTTLTEHILNAHRDVHGAGELPGLHRLAVRLAGSAETATSVKRLAELDAATLDREAEAYLGELRALAPAARYVVDKMPANARLLGFIACLLPRARIIHCVRDPRDIGLSIYKLRFFGYHPYAHDLSDLGFAIAEHFRLMAHWRSVLPGRILDIALTDWVEDFAGTLERVLQFLGLPYDKACERFYEQKRKVRTASTQQVRKPINTRGIDRWRGYADQLAPLIAELEAHGVLPRPQQLPT